MDEISNNIKNLTQRHQRESETLSRQRMAEEKRIEKEYTGRETLMKKRHEAEINSLNLRESVGMEVKGVNNNNKVGVKENDRKVH